MGSGHHHHHHHHHHHGLPHSHDHDHDHDDKAVGRIRTAFFLNMGFALIELVGGIITGSFAIVADAIHDFGDSLSLALALFMQKKSSEGPSPSLSYGYLRYSVLSAIVSGMIILSGSFVILVEAVQNLMQPAAMPNAKGMIGLAILGIIANGIAAFRLSHGHSHNEKILSWHLIEDLLGWIVVLIGAVCILFFGISWLDPLLAVGIAIFVSWNVIRNLREPFRIILQYVPGEEDLTQLRSQLEAIEGVQLVSEIHAWTLDGYQHVVTAHIVAEGDLVRERAKKMLKDKGYRYVTLEVTHGEAHVPPLPPC